MMMMMMMYAEYYALMEKEINACTVAVVSFEGPRRRCEDIIKLQLIGRNRESVA